MKGRIYPFKIRIRDPELANTFKILCQKRVVKIPDMSTASKVRAKIKPIRRDIFWGTDRRYYRNFIALPPNLSMDFELNGKNYDFIIKPIF